MEIQRIRERVMKNNRETIKIVLDEVQQEYQRRYEWGDEGGACRSLFFKIRGEVEVKIIRAFNEEDTLSKEEILLVVSKFRDGWNNESTDCDDTDGRIHINSIYSKLEENLRESEETVLIEKKTSFYPRGFLFFYIIFLILLFAFFVGFVDSL